MMPDFPGSTLLAVYERHSSLGDELIMRRYADEEDEAALDDFLFNVHNSFLNGVHTAHLHAVIRALMEKLGNQQSVAEALGLKHRTSISQMLRSQTIDGIRLTAALDQFRDIIKLPPRSLSALYGFARATSFVRALDLKDASINGTLGPQEFSFLAGVLACDEFDEAVRHEDPAVGRMVAARIARERALVLPWPPPAPGKRPRLRPEQFVLPLVQLRDEWGTYAVVALAAIPECIPAEEDAEATL